jgi:1,4-dihydroxy-2-naphthoate octaprenyltransferase
VLVGTALAAEAAEGPSGSVIWWRAAAALVVALALQIATNYANDYSDGVRGTDRDRVGPVRLVGSGLMAPRRVLAAVSISFAVAGVAGFALTIAVGPELLVVGAASMLAGWFYTGGSRPYGYHGFGELFVFVFFGLVATAGTFYVQVEEVTVRAVIAGAGVGALACALLVVNNLRDIPTDRDSAKQTLAVRMGDRATRVSYVVLVVGAFAVVAGLAPGSAWVLVGFVAVVAAVAPVRTVLSGAVGRDLVGALAGTGRLQLLYGVLVTAGIWIGAS